MSNSNGYALDISQAVRHVATELDRAAPAALSARTIAATYGAEPGDISRVRDIEHGGRITDTEAVEWIITEAIGELSDQVKPDGDGYKLAVPADDLRWDGKKVNLIIESNDRDREREQRAAVARVRQAQDPSSKGPRPIDQKHIQALRDSIEEFGKHDKLFPVLISKKDGSILDGRHRLAVDPTWEPRYVSGLDDDEAARIMLIGNRAKAWSKAEWEGLADTREAVGHQATKRERIKAALLEWPDLSHREIAKKLGDVHQTYVNRICAEVKHQSSLLCTHGKSGQGARTDLADRQDKKTKRTPELEAEVLGLIEAGLPVPRKELARKYDVGESVVQRTQTAMQAVHKDRQRQAEQQQSLPPESPPAPLPEQPQESHAHRWVCVECGEPFRS